MNGKIRKTYLCMEGNRTIAHAVETTTGVLIGTRVGADFKSLHEVARTIQETFDITPMEHAMLMNNAIVMNKADYERFLEKFKQIPLEEAKERIGA